MPTYKATVIREGDERTTILELPGPFGVIDRRDPDMDWRTDEEVISQMVYQHYHVQTTSVEVYEVLEDRIRYLAVTP